MKKLLNGILEFRRSSLADYRRRFASLARGQNPDALMIACADSRVVPNVFASTDPGDLFVARNVGNLVPCCCGSASCGSAEAAAIEFGLATLHVADVIVCGHSECGAMQTILGGREDLSEGSLREWLRHGDPSLRRLRSSGTGEGSVNELSKVNVLQQMEHVRSYPVVQERLARGEVRIHGWWFELATADVYFYDERDGRFRLIDESSPGRMVT
jgi:carbonic anhydrase